MSRILSITFLFSFSGLLLAQNMNWTKQDSLRGEAMIKTIEQSLYYFYAENGSETNFDSILSSAYGCNLTQLPICAVAEKPEKAQQNKLTMRLLTVRHHRKRLHETTKMESH